MTAPRPRRRSRQTRSMACASGNGDGSHGMRARSAPHRTARFARCSPSGKPRRGQARMTVTPGSPSAGAREIRAALGESRRLVRRDRAVQRLREPADADRPAVHAPGLRPGADLALGGDAGGVDRHRRLPVPDDGPARPRPRHACWREPGRASRRASTAGCWGRC